MVGIPFGVCGVCCGRVGEWAAAAVGVECRAAAAFARRA